ncbi:MotA/TolQ/ExbB proton channel family protein [Gammaproteobacteria bacterium LSUCC0112]|nr:MotA/TolQ/ExbB proton channel family protein [Gammaproteobacteria bacterium LSUCC0112]
MKKNIIKLAGISFTGLFLAVSTQAFAQQPAANLAELLRNVEENRVLESQDAREREQRFQQQVNQQQQILEETRSRITEEEAENARLEGVFDANRQLLTERRAQLREVRANLNELLGTIQGVAGDFRGVFENSLISAQYPGRNEFLDNFIARVSSDTEQVRVDEIERFWFYMQQELVESGRVVKYQGTVGLPSGEQETRTITRIGSFNAIANGDYLSYTGAVGHLQVLPRQPSADVVGRAAALENAQSGIHRVGIDPTGALGGSLMANLINFPTAAEQVRDNSGTIGFAIIGLGIIGVLVGLLRSFILTLVSAKVSAQIKSGKANKNNPLGRVLLVAESNPNVDTETLELKLGEAILQETPALESLLTMIKIISTIAPLMGLLGTVTGMIQVFQQITVYGAGDPTIMAGGISMALMTTVLGIVAAIPCILMHAWVKSKSDRIIHVLEEQATGIIAKKAEASGKQA